MTAPSDAAESVERGPAVLERSDRYELRLLGAAIGALVLTAGWHLLGRSESDAPSVPTTIATYAAALVSFLPTYPGDLVRKYSLRMIVALIVWLSTWVVIGLLGFGRLDTSRVGGAVDGRACPCLTAVGD